MTRTEASNLFTQKIQQLWPDWQPNEAEEFVWTKQLGFFDYDIARQGLENYYAEKGSVRKRPSLNLVLEKVKVLQQKQHPRPKTNEPVLVYKLECIKNEQYPHRAGQVRTFYRPTKATLPPRDILMKWAEQARVRHEQLYAGNWIVLADADTAISLDNLQ